MSRLCLAGKNIVLYIVHVLFRVVKMTVKTSQKCPCVHIWVYSQNRQLTGLGHYIAGCHYSATIVGGFNKCMYVHVCHVHDHTCVC